MYINVKNRKNKKDVKVFYLYVCESHRVEGKVKNTQKYFGSIKETDILDGDFSALDEAFADDKWSEDEIDKVKLKLESILSDLKRQST